MARSHDRSTARFRGAAAVASAVLGCAAAAQDVAAPPQQLIVTGSRLPFTPAGLAQNITVIDAQQIRQSSPARLEDLLARVTGVYVDSAGQSGGFSSLYMRGAEQSHLLIMIDGVKVNDPTTTRGSAYDLSSIDVQQIERIEVLRGPASAVHGGEALAGVLHIITRQPGARGSHGSAYAAAGQQGHRKAGASLGAGGDTVRGGLAVGTSRDGDGSDGRLRVDSFSGSLHVSPAAWLDGELFAHRAERKSDAFPDDSGGPRLAVNRALTRRDADDSSYGASVGVGDPKRVRLRAGVSRYERDETSDNAFVDPGVRFPVPAFTSDTRFRRTTLHAAASREWADAAQLVVGFERQHERGELTSVGDFDFDGSPETLQFGLRRRTDSWFAESRFKLAKPLALQLGVRRDKVERLAARTTPHVGAVWDFATGATTLKANYNKGFKPPSFFALGFPIGANPALRPERSENAELTLAHRFGAAFAAQASVFRIDYTDLVDFDPATFSYINRGTVVVKGIEPSFDLRLGDRLRAQVGLTLLDIDERDGLAPLRNRPKKRAVASASYDIDGRSSLFAAVSSTGSFLDRSNPTGDIGLPGFTTVDVVYSFAWHASRAKLALDNVLDKRYEQFVGFPALGRRVRGELRFDF